MSQPDANESTPFSGSPRLEYGTIQRGQGGNSGDGAQLDKEEEEEVQRQFNRNMKQLGCAMVLLPATIITRRLLTNAWNSWCIVLIIVLATRTGPQDLEDTEVTSELPAQVLKGMDMSHSTYRLDAFDCHKPEDVITQSIPESCAVEAEEQEDVEKEFEARQYYTILQKVPTFEYAANLCTLHKSQHYYKCV